MTRGLTVALVLASSSFCQAGLLTNFAASYALYQQCTMSNADFDADNDIDGMDFLNWQRGLAQVGQFIDTHGDADRNSFVNQLDLNLWMNQFATNTGVSDSLCFKLFLDPEGIIAGNVTVIINVPNPQPGQVRLGFSNLPNVIAVHPQYSAQATQANIFPLPGRERLEARVAFAANDPTNPPAGPLTIFGYQIMDNLPQLGLGGVQIGFEFRPGDFITVFDPDNGQTTTFDSAELDDVPVPLMCPLFLDVSTSSGAVSLRNPGHVPIAINFYEIKGVSGALDPAGWVSLDDAEMGDPPGVGWDEAGGVNANVLAETNLMNALVLEPFQSRSLGRAFNKSTGIRDLTLSYSTPLGSLIHGEINYNLTSSSGVVPEPGCFALALVGLVGVAIRRRLPFKAGHGALPLW